MDQKPPTPERRLATRFTLQMTMRYRAMNDAAWHEGRTENVAKNGVFFRDDHLLQVDTPVEMILQLPVELGGEAGATTTCRGRIVRMEQSLLPDRRPGMAATIESFLMTHGDPRRV
jgi:PilZ domain